MIAATAGPAQAGARKQPTATRPKPSAAITTSVAASTGNTRIGSAWTRFDTAASG